MTIHDEDEVVCANDRDDIDNMIIKPKEGKVKYIDLWRRYLKTEGEHEKETRSYRKMPYEDRPEYQDERKKTTYLVRRKEKEQTLKYVDRGGEYKDE